jgi:ABC-type microcin C transport system duplicated ATPase subunit YejF
MMNRMLASSEKVLVMFETIDEIESGRGLTVDQAHQFVYCLREKLGVAYSFIWHSGPYSSALDEDIQVMKEGKYLVEGSALHIGTRGKERLKEVGAFTEALKKEMKADLIGLLHKSNVDLFRCAYAQLTS